MNPLFRKKLENIHSNLMEAHRNSVLYPPTITGAEREIVQRELLSLILPVGYRMGTGAIIDQFGNNSGQVDVVIEQPFSVSFPIVSESNRLYLAATICVAFEVKSNLAAQKSEALEKVKSIKKLFRSKIKKDEIVCDDDIHIPVFIIGYQGPKTDDSIEKNFINPRNSLAPNGVLVIESERFYGRAAGGDWHIATGKAECIFSFFTCVINSIRNASNQEFDIYNYVNLLKD